MILLCVGTLGPFNRLVRAVDQWAWKNPASEIFAQIGDTSFVPRNMEYIKNFYSLTRRNRKFDRADLLICDLSVELLLPACERHLPVLALPRLSIFGEETGIDQITLARHLKSDEFITIARDETHLQSLISVTPARKKQTGGSEQPDTLTQLLKTIRKA
ncbi:MAG TPA: hypothetical protein ENJ68_05560 [Devosia sp.]|nr:hypothetical protein [Devosia sp.]